MATTAVGRVAINIDYESADAKPGGKISMYDLMRTGIGPLWKGVKCRYTPAAAQLRTYFVSASNPAGLDPRVTTPATLNVATVDVDASLNGKVVGEIWVSYRIALMVPNLVGGVTSGSIPYGLALVNYSTALLPNNTSIAITGTTAVSYPPRSVPSWVVAPSSTFTTGATPQTTLIVNLQMQLPYSASGSQYTPTPGLYRVTFYLGRTGGSNFQLSSAAQLSTTQAGIAVRSWEPNGVGTGLVANAMTVYSSTVASSSNNATTDPGKAIVTAIVAVDGTVINSIPIVSLTAAALGTNSQTGIAIAAECVRIGERSTGSVTATRHVNGRVVRVTTVIESVNGIRSIISQDSTDAGPVAADMALLPASLAALPTAAINPPPPPSTDDSKGDVERILIDFKESMVCRLCLAVHLPSHPCRPLGR
jgi:hypothetical protein